MAGYNGSGTFVRVHNWVTDKGNAVKVTASRMDAEDDGFATGLSTAICKDGQTTTTAAIPFAVGIKLSDGSEGTPSLGFINDTDSGFYRIGANNIGLSIGGSKVIDFGTATASITGSLVVGGTLNPAGGVAFADGAVDAPSIAFASDPNTGLYSIGADNLGVTIGGTKIMDVSTTAVGAKAVTPLTSDGGALGTTSLMWSDLFLAAGGTVNWNNGALTFTESSGSLVAASTVSGATLRWDTTDTGATGPVFTLYHNSSSPANSDAIGIITFNGNDSGGNATTYGQIHTEITDTTNGSEDAKLLFKVEKAGTLTTIATVDGTGITVTGAVSGSTVAGNLVASQSDQETGTSTSKVVTPGTQQSHASAAKAWVYFQGSDTVTILRGYNVTSITDNNTGDYTINFTTAFSDANYSLCGSSQSTGSTNNQAVCNIVAASATGSPTSKTTSACRISYANAGSGSLVDFANNSAHFFGDQA